MYKANLKQFPTPAVPKTPGPAPEIVRKGSRVTLQGFHGSEFPGYPATSFAQRLGEEFGLTERGEGKIVYRVMVRCGLTQEGEIGESIRKTVISNAVKHLPGRNATSKGCDIAPNALKYCRSVRKVVEKELAAERKAAEATLKAKQQKKDPSPSASAEAAEKAA